MALPTSIELQIVTPDKLLVKEQVDEVEIPGTEGYFGVLPGHTPMLASLAVGEMWYRKGQEKTWISRIYDPECLSCHVTGWEPQNVLRYHSGYIDRQST